MRETEIHDIAETVTSGFYNNVYNNMPQNAEPRLNVVSRLWPKERFLWKTIILPKAKAARLSYIRPAVLIILAIATELYCTGYIMAYWMAP